MSTIDYTDIPLPDTELADLAVRWLDTSDRLCRQARRCEPDSTDATLMVAQSVAYIDAANAVIDGRDRSQVASDIYDGVCIAQEFYTGPEMVGRLAAWHNIREQIEREPRHRATMRRIAEQTKAGQDGARTPTRAERWLRMLGMGRAA